VGLSVKIFFVSLLGGIALYFRGNAAKEKLRNKVTELKSVKRNRDMLVTAQRALHDGYMQTEEETRDEIKRIKAGDRDHFKSGW